MKWGERKRVPADRDGKTGTVQAGKVTAQVTANTFKGGKVGELFAKCNEGHQGWTDAVCVMASLALQYGCPLAVVVKHLRHRSFEPCGFGEHGFVRSIPDGIAAWLEREYPKQAKDPS